METTITVPEIWGQAALAKKQAHYSRLRTNQVRKRAKKHLKRLNQMDAMKSRLIELGVPWVPNPLFDARRKFESLCYYLADAVYRKYRSLSAEKQLEIQRGFKKLPLSAV